MQIEAFYEDGRVEFAQSVCLKPGPVRVIIEIPDEQLLGPEQASEQTSEQASRASGSQPTEQRSSASTAPLDGASPRPLREAIDAIIAPYKDQLRPTEPLSAPEVKALWHEHLEVKHLDRG